MFTYNGGYPLIAYYIPKGSNTQSRIVFRCRKVSEAAQFFSQNINGVIDTGTNLTIIAPKRFDFVAKDKPKVIIDGIIYSVESINPYVPDQANVGPFNRKKNVQYLIQLV
jgi:hypothetical protein